MNSLINIGFSQVGYWTLTNPDTIAYTLNSNHNTRNVLYAFISNGKIKYIGKTTQTLDKRMYGYQNPGLSQSTNIRVNGEIKKLLKQNNLVDIFILADNGLLSFGGFRINLAAGLEDTLINKLNPKWNMSGKTKIQEDKESEDPNLTGEVKTKDNIKTLDSFDIILGQIYLRQGFINVPVSHSNLLAGDTTTIELVLGDNNEIIHGYINRRANKGGNPRIIGGVPLRDWFQKNFKKDETLRVTIVSPISIRLTKD